MSTGDLVESIGKGTLIVETKKGTRAGQTGTGPRGRGGYCRFGAVIFPHSQISPTFFLCSCSLLPPTPRLRQHHRSSRSEKTIGLTQLQITLDRSSNLVRLGQLRITLDSVDNLIATIQDWTAMADDKSIGVKNYEPSTREDNIRSSMACLGLLNHRHHRSSSCRKLRLGKGNGIKAFFFNPNKEPILKEALKVLVSPTTNIYVHTHFFNPNEEPNLREDLKPIFSIIHRLPNPWTRPKSTRFKRVELGPVLKFEISLLASTRPVAFSYGSGPVPPNLGPARAQP
ncbi:hypothetical protein DVH24_023151 [Malus domestica]|uniref:Uncharacterized protein n=1 Tax=Malus domestica TaxID=3750 RepID=A0A498KN87_MALDO|nr:hypothetical protein DVH24_023151 [Malus domestica]